MSETWPHPTAESQYALHLQDAYNNPVNASQFRCQADFQATAGSSAPNFSQACSTEETDASALKAVLYTEIPGIYNFKLFLQPDGLPLFALPGR